MLFWWSLTIGYHLKVCLFVFYIRSSLFAGLGILSIQIIGLLTAKKNNTNNWTFVLIPDILMIRLSYSCVHFTKCSTIATRQNRWSKNEFRKVQITRSQIYQLFSTSTQHFIYNYKYYTNNSFQSFWYIGSSRVWSFC